MNKLVLGVTLLMLSFSYTASAQRPVYVAAYDFPPFFSATLESDVTTELVALLNKRQSNYEFIIQAIPPNGRYQALSAAGCCDVMFFESIIWGWQNQSVDVSTTQPLLAGRERLVAKRKPGRDQQFFNELSGKTLGGVRGYHYLLAGKVMNSAEVAKRYSIYLADSRITNLRMLIGDRIDAVVLNDELLSALANSPVNYLDQLLLADKIEHEYEMSIVVANNKGISRVAMQQLLRDLARDGSLQALFSRFNLQRFQLYPR